MVKLYGTVSSSLSSLILRAVSYVTLLYQVTISKSLLSKIYFWNILEVHSGKDEKTLNS